MARAKAKAKAKTPRKSAARAGTAGQLIHVGVGAPAGDGGVLAAQFAVADPNATLRVELPGAVVDFGAGFSFGIVPVARIIAGAGRDARAARVSFAEKSERATREALEPFYAALRRKKPRSFGLLVEGDGLSFAAVFAAAARVVGHHSKTPAGPVTLRMVSKLAGGGVARSQAFAGLVVADPVPAEDLPGAVIPLGVRGSFWDGEWYLFDCHSEWRWDGAALRWYTVCRGPCAGGGNCTIILENPPKRAAWGLQFCAC